MRLAREHARNGGGVLAVLHNLNLAAAIADEIAVLHRGAIVACGPPTFVRLKTRTYGRLLLDLTAGKTGDHQ